MDIQLLLLPVPLLL